MADNMILATIHILVGFEIFGLGFLNSGRDTDAEEAMFIIAMLLYLTSAILIILIKAGGLGGNKIALIATMILVLCAALFILVGVALWWDNPGDPTSYVITLDIVGLAMAVIGGIFLILAVAGGGGKTGP